MSNIDFVFFGTDKFSTTVLDELEKARFLPELIVTAPDRPAGRGQKLTPSPVAQWAAERGIETLKPERLNEDTRYKIQDTNPDVLVVASYGKIIPKEVLDIPEHGALNVHPSLLPLYRGPLPIQSQILDGAEMNGVTIMLMDEKMDHGPIVAQKEFPNHKSQTKDLPTTGELEAFLAHKGGQLLAETIPQWVRGEILPQEQDHDAATYTKKITKADCEIAPDDVSEATYRRIQACTPNPGAYFFTEENGRRMRVKITEAGFESDALTIKKVIPEGKREMSYKEFRQ